MSVAKVGSDPVLNSPRLAQEALERDLEKGLRELSYQRPEPLTLLVPLFGNPDSESPDLYLLRLQFSYYPEWPPSAQFVNPLTRQYDKDKDLAWLPRIEGNQRIQVHPNYQTQGGQSIQLICSSMTLEFYKVRHDCKESDIWTNTHSFAATLNEIRMGLRPDGGYKGRMG
jgi:hypothetical protein